VRIRAVRSIPLYGTAPDAGWFDRVDRSQNLQPLVELATDDGVVSYCLTRVVNGT